MSETSIKNTVQNVAINGSALFLCSLVNVIFLGYLAVRLGLQEYGLIVLVRTLLATGALAMLDLGLSEAAAVRVAALRASGNQQALAGTVVLATALTLVIGIVAGAVMGLAADLWVGLLLRNDPGVQADFAIVAVLLAATLAVQLPGVVCESVLRGLNRFPLLRAIEVAFTMAFAGAGVVLVEGGSGYRPVVLLLVGLVVLRALAAIVLAFGSVLRGHAIERPNRQLFGDLYQLASPILVGKTLAVLNFYTIFYASSVLVGAAGLGGVDLLMRWPRFMKMFFGQLNQTIMPLAVGLDTTGRQESLERTYRKSLTFALGATMPALLAAAFFAEEILLVWLNPELAVHWRWLSALFFWPLVVLPVGLGGAMLMGRPHFIARNNLYAAGQLLVILGVAVTTAAWLGERAVLLAHLCGIFAVLPFQTRLIDGHMRIPRWETLRVVARVALGVPPAVLVGIVIKAAAIVSGPLTLLAGVGLWCAVSWTTIYVAVFSAEERSQVRRVAFMILGR